MKSILITGSSGMVGRSLVKNLKNKYKIFTPSSKELNLDNINKIEKYLRKKKPTHIVHLAGYIGGIGANTSEPVRFLQENILIGINLIKTSHKLKIKNFLNMGSSCIYPVNQKKPNKEEKLLNGKIEKTNESYALAKISCVKMCEYISRNSSMNYFSLIPCNIYGPFDKYNNTNSHVIGSLIKKIHEAKYKNKKSVEIWGNGKSKRELIYVDDVANAIEKFLSKKILVRNKKYWLNIGTGTDFSITSIAKKIAKEFNYKGKFFYNKQKPNGAKSKLLDVRLSKIMGFEAKVNLNDGLKKTADWYLKNYTKY